MISHAAASSPSQRQEIQPVIDQVFFTQQHVQSPDDPLFKLVGNLETLIKVQVYAREPVSAPAVIAKLELGGKMRKMVLRGPAQLPEPTQNETGH